MSSLNSTDINHLIANRIWSEPGEIFNGHLKELVASIPELAAVPMFRVHNALTYQRRRCKDGKAMFMIAPQGGSTRQKEWIVVDETNES